VLRAERGLTLREAAALTGVTKETLSDLERGLRHPQDPTLAKIARGYGIPFEELLEEPVPPGKAAAPPLSSEIEERRTIDYSIFAEILNGFCEEWEARREAKSKWEEQDFRAFHKESRLIISMISPLWVQEIAEAQQLLGREPQPDDLSMWPAIDRYTALERSIRERDDNPFNDAKVANLLFRLNQKAG
jgi:transcriptional regulator with XRE-family HTH domain